MLVYSCAECSAPVEVFDDGTIVRECEHAEAGVLADLTAIVYGEGAAQ